MKSVTFFVLLLLASPALADHPPQAPPAHRPSKPPKQAPQSLDSRLLALEIKFDLLSRQLTDLVESLAPKESPRPAHGAMQAGCSCSPDCTCGCQEGGECKCNDSPAPAAPPRTTKARRRQTSFSGGGRSRGSC